MSSTRSFFLDSLFCPINLTFSLCRCIAPEILMKHQYSLASDVYSFGILLWYCFVFLLKSQIRLMFNSLLFDLLLIRELLTCCEPYKNKTVFEVKQCILRDIKPPLSQLPEEVDFSSPSSSFSLSLSLVFKMTFFSCFPNSNIFWLKLFVLFLLGSSTARWVVMLLLESWTRTTSFISQNFGSVWSDITMWSRHFRGCWKRKLWTFENRHSKQCEIWTQSNPSNN